MAGSTLEFASDVIHLDRPAVVRLSGELDMATAPELDAWPVTAEARQQLVVPLIDVGDVVGIALVRLDPRHRRAQPGRWLSAIGWKPALAANGGAITMGGVTAYRFHGSRRGVVQAFRDWCWGQFVSVADCCPADTVTPVPLGCRSSTSARLVCGFGWM